jgi:hypothetical protein
MGRFGAFGTRLMVTGESAVLVQVVSAVFLTVKVYTPGNKDAKTGDDWNVVPMLYSTPDCASKVIVPEGTAQVGCTRVAVGANGAVGMLSITVLTPVV